MSFSAKESYSGVRQQQGRVELDGGWNELDDILLKQKWAPSERHAGKQAKIAAMLGISDRSVRRTIIPTN